MTLARLYLKYFINVMNDVWPCCKEDTSPLVVQFVYIPVVIYGTSTN